MRNILGILFLFQMSQSFGQTDEILNKVISIPKKTVSFPLEYCNTFPSLKFLQWNKDFDYFDTFVTPTINKTQQGITFIYDSIHYWICKPSIRPHVQLDTSTIITDKQKIIGTWRTVQNRNINFTDSATYIDSTIRRKVFLLNENNNDDIILTISDKKYTLYLKESSSDKFKNVLSTNYSIGNKRYLMLYKFTKCCPGLSLIGIDKEGRLIVSSYAVEQRHFPKKYITYNAVQAQFIFERIE